MYSISVYCMSLLSVNDPDGLKALILRITEQAEILHFGIFTICFDPALVNQVCSRVVCKGTVL